MALSDIPADATVLTVNTLNDLGTIDITNNTLDINYGVNISPVAAIGTLVKTGYNNAGFNGTGITSSKVKSVNAAHSNSHLYAVGYADSADTAVALDHFATNTVVVKAAIVGDANLDGKVSYTDSQLLSANINSNNTSWDQANFNFGPKTAYIDFQLLSANINDSTPLDNASGLGSGNDKSSDCRWGGDHCGFFNIGCRRYNIRYFAGYQRVWFLR